MYNTHIEIDKLYEKLGLPVVGDTQIRNTLNQGNLWKQSKECQLASDNVKVSLSSSDKILAKG